MHNSHIPISINVYQGDYDEILGSSFSFNNFIITDLAPFVHLHKS